MPSLLERFQGAIHGVPTWPPAEVDKHWERVQGYRRRASGDRAELLPYAVDVNRTLSGRRSFTPVPIAREIGAFSAAMLFSESPQITYEKDPDLLDEVKNGNSLAARFHAGAEQIAIEGRGGLRVHWDDTVPGDVKVQIHYVPEDNILWEERHGDIVTGGGVVIEKVPEEALARQADIVYRLIEEHEIGSITRTLYKGNSRQLGEQVDLDALVDFADLDEVLETGLDAPTLFRWNNKPGGTSDLAGLETLLDRYDEGWTLLVDKLRKSVPVSFAPATLFNENGTVDLSGVIALRGTRMQELGQDGDFLKQFGTVQPDLQAESHIAVLDKMRETILQYAGYSLASWGLEVSGTADSGTALTLKQSRTIQTKAAKEWEATEVIKNALACAMCWHDGGSTVSDYRPEIQLADGTPRDEREEAANAALWHSQEAISLEERIRARRPDWDDEQVEEEAERLRAEKPKPPAMSGLPIVPGRLDLEEEEEEEGEGA